MMREEHLAADRERFGRDFNSVHEDLDSTYDLIGHPHRADTHFLEYVLDKWKKGEWNVDQVRAALHHIIDDCGIIMVEDDWGTADKFLKDL